MKNLFSLVAITFIGFIGNAQIVNIPDANFKAQLLAASTTTDIAYNASNARIKVDTNNDGNIQLSEALLVYRLAISSQSIASLTGIESFTSLTNLDCSYNSITTLNVSTLPNLQILNCAGNRLTSLSVTNKNYLTDLDCGGNLITSLDITNSMALNYVDVSGNQLTTLNIANRPNLDYLNCSTNLMSSLTMTNDLLLNSLYIDNNQFQTINLNPFTNLTGLALGANPYTSVVNLGTLVNLQFLFIENLTAPGMCPLTDSAMPNLTSLNTLKTDGSSFGNVHYNLIPNLQTLLCRNTGMTVMDYVPHGINAFAVETNQITSMNLTPFTNLGIANFANNPITSLVFGTHPGLTTVYASRTNLTDIDASGLSDLTYISINNCPNLVTCNVKNGITNTVGSLLNCPNLRYICCDASDITGIQNVITTAGLTNCHVNSYCSFTPGGTFYTIQGNNRFDSNNNGCDVADINYPNLRLSFTSGSTYSALIADTKGAYHYDVQAGTQTFTPVLENPSYFLVSPTTATVTFPTSPSPFTQNFCVSANGIYNDLEVTLLPLGPARPGFDAKYKIIYKNKGTTVQSGIVSLTFGNSIEDFVTSNPNFTSQSTNTLNWNFSNLLPFESREISVTFNLNSPVETPPLNAGNLIIYYATVTGATDETPADNISELTQTAINSLDPNDKTCTEGANLPVSEVGKYLHYIIRFENNGTANAQNIVVKDIIDTSKLDISTLVPLNGSHSFVTKISSTNKVEFIFQNINLPFDNANNDGYVAFKIKSLPTLVAGNLINNSANIYFDYNAPITTNTNMVNVYNPLTTTDFDFASVFTLSPVPTKNSLRITTKQEVILSSVNIYNTIGQLVQVITNPNESIDVSGLKTGSYFIKIISDKGTATSKFIKE